MKKLSIILLVFSLASVSATQAQTQTPADQKTTEDYIRKSEAEWAESVASGDVSAIARILADDFVGIDPKGKSYTKQQMISETREAPKYFVSNHLDDVKIRFYGNTALAQGSESWVKRNGERGRFVWTDTWIQRDGKWQIVAAEDLIVMASEQPRK